MLAFLWAVQLGFVNSLSRFITIYQLRRTADSVVRNIDNDDVDKLAVSLSYRNNISIMVIDKDGQIIIKTETRASLISQLSETELIEKYKQAETAGGSLLEQQNLPLENLEEYNFAGKYANAQDTTECNIFTTIVPTQYNGHLAIIVEATSLPVSVINSTMLVQLVIISAVILASTLLLAYMMSRIIARPIVSLSLSAKELARGKHNVSFEAMGYKEIEELQNSLNTASKELSAVDRYRRELIANVSHDLKTPLTLIKGYTEMMRDFPTESTPANIQVVIDETERLSNLVNDMLDLSKLQDGGFAIRPESFDLVELVQEVAGRYSKMLEAKGYTIELQHEPTAIVWADKAKITQVLYNLISNAVTYSGADKLIKIREYRHHNNARIDIIDNGEGIDVSALPYIWDRYYKSEKSHKRAQTGTGLGLSIVKSVIARHPGGVYGVESSVGNGSKFYFELPLLEIKL